MNKLILISVFSALALFSACEKHKEDANAPNISILNPTEGQVFKNGDTVRIKGTVSDEELHEMELSVIKSNDTTVYFKASPYVHEKASYDLNEYFVVDKIADSTNAVLTVTAHDHHEHSTTKKVNLLLIP